MKKENVTQLEIKYLNALNDLYNSIKYKNKVSMNSIIKEHKVNHNFGRILKEAKIIINEGSSKYPIYKWSSIRPNIHMTREVILELSKLSNFYRNKKKTPVKAKSKKTTNINVKTEAKTTKLIKSTTVSMFWGLYKKTVTNN